MLIADFVIDKSLREDESVFRQKHGPVVKQLYNGTDRSLYGRDLDSIFKDEWIKALATIVPTSTRKYMTDCDSVV